MTEKAVTKLGISVREFARRSGCSDTAVRKAVRSARLCALPDGSIDPALVFASWRRAPIGAAASGEIPGTCAGAGPESHAAVFAPLLQAVAAVIARSEALSAAWATWPARVGPEVARELGLDANLVVAVLEQHVAAQRAALGDCPAEPAPTSAGVPEA